MPKASIIIFVASLCFIFSCNHSDNSKLNFSVHGQGSKDSRLTEGAIKSFEIYSMLRFDGLNGTARILSGNFPFHKECIIDRKYFKFEDDTTSSDSAIVYFYKQAFDQAEILSVSNLFNSKQLEECKRKLSFRMCIVLTNTDMHQTYLFFDEERFLHIDNVCYSVDKEMFKKLIAFFPADMYRTWAAGL